MKLCILSTALLTCMAMSSLASDVKVTKPTNLTDDQLQQMLEDLGYEPKAIPTKSGGKLFEMAAARDGWTFHFRAGLRGDKTNVWLSAHLGKLPESGKVSAEALEKLLQSNINTSPAHFVVKGNRSISLELPIEAADVTPGRLRELVDAHLAVIKATHSIWHAASQPVGMNVAGAAK